MNEFSKKFIKDVYINCNRANLTLDDEYNIWYNSEGRKLVIPAYEIIKYYKGYIMSHQTRKNAIARATQYVVHLVGECQEAWNKL